MAEKKIQIFLTNAKYVSAFSGEPSYALIVSNDKELNFFPKSYIHMGETTLHLPGAQEIQKRLAEIQSQ